MKRKVKSSQSSKELVSVPQKEVWAKNMLSETKPKWPCLKYWPQLCAAKMFHVFQSSAQNQGPQAFEMKPEKWRFPLSPPAFPHLIWGLKRKNNQAKVYAQQHISQGWCVESSLKQQFKRWYCWAFLSEMPIKALKMGDICWNIWENEEEVLGFEKVLWIKLTNQTIKVLIWLQKSQNSCQNICSSQCVASFSASPSTVYKGVQS